MLPHVQKHLPKHGQTGAHRHHGAFRAPRDPLLRSFPSEDYTTPVWYTILQHAHCEPVEPDRMIAEMIDNPTRAQRLGILYIKDGYLHLTSRLWEAQDAPEVKALALSLLKGMDSLPDRKA